MVFTSSFFLFVFLPVTLILYYILPTRSSKNVSLFILSILFYAWGEPKFVIIMLISIFANWLFGLLVEEMREKNNKVSRIIVVCSVVFNLLIIFVFKYLNFAVENLNRFGRLNIQIQTIMLPIGISFFTFQAISYVVDVYRRNGEAQHNPINVGLYIAFFPQLIAGPIVRYETIAEQMYHRKETISMFTEGVTYFVRGFCKKVLLANNMAIVADKAFDLSDGELSIGFAWLGAIAYTFQIFFDFSGYSEMAIGLGKMFGFEFLPNFNYPYISKSISEFWRRWHISLGSWFRDYVYFPLGGSRVKNKGRLIFNLFVVWALTGVWHGANWTFILWGLMYFVLITIEKITEIEKNEKFSRFLVLKYSYTMLFVILGWVIFRSDNIGVAIDYVCTMFGIGNNVQLWDYLARFYFMEYMPFFIACIICSVPIGKCLKNNKLFQYDIIKYFVYGLLFLISVTYIVKGSYNPFIYFNF